MADINLVPYLVAILGAGGLGAFAREIADVISKLRSGVSARESKRKNDIVAQRNEAVTAAEAERKRRIAFQEYAGTLRYQLRENGLSPEPLPDDLEDTLNPHAPKEPS